MAEWFETKAFRPFEGGRWHGVKRVLTYWPVHAVDGDGNVSATVIGGRQHVVTYVAMGEAGYFTEPLDADERADWRYAAQPSHWAMCLADPDGIDTNTTIYAVDGELTCEVVPLVRT